MLTVVVESTVTIVTAYEELITIGVVSKPLAVTTCTVCKGEKEVEVSQIHFACIVS